MPVLSNARHEKFAQLLAQLHGEMTVTDAHEQAGYKRNDGNASTLAQHPDVQKRVKEIKGRAAAKVVVTVESLMDEAEQARAQAMASGQLSAAVSAIKEKGVCPASASSGPRLAARPLAPMSALSRKRTSSGGGRCPLSAISDRSAVQQNCSLFDHLVGGGIKNN